MQLVTFLRPYWLLCPLTATNPIPSTSHIPNTNRSVWKGMLLVVLNFVRQDYMRLVQLRGLCTNDTTDMTISLWPFFPVTNSWTLGRPFKIAISLNVMVMLMISKLNRNSEFCLYTFPNFNKYNLLLLFCHCCSIIYPNLKNFVPYATPLTVCMLYIIFYVVFSVRFWELKPRTC